MTTFMHVWHEISRLRATRATHCKEGFAITSLRPLEQTNHLLEEAVELQAEVLRTSINRDAILVEAADILVVLLHLLVMYDISAGELMDASLKSLADHWDDGQVSDADPTGGWLRDDESYGEQVRRVVDALLLTDFLEVDEEVVRSWGYNQRLGACRWAFHEHLSAADNPVERLPEPRHVKALRTAPGSKVAGAGPARSKET